MASSRGVLALLTRNGNFASLRLDSAARCYRIMDLSQKRMLSLYNRRTESMQTSSKKLCCCANMCRQGLSTITRLSPNVFGTSLDRLSQPWAWLVMRSYAKKGKKDKGSKGGKKKIAVNPADLDGVLDHSHLQDDMHAVVEDLKQQMVQQVSIRTNIGVYDNLPVKTDDGVFPLVQLAQVVQKNPTLILINMAASPQYLKPVKDAISQSGLNVNPQQDGSTIFVPVPKVTREYREGLAKNAKMITDKAKIRLRDIHNKYIKKVKAVKDHHSEDLIRGAQDLVLDEMHKYSEQLDTILQTKQQELLGGK